MWLRRSALLFQLKYKQNTDAQRLFKYCAETMHEKEFFIRKAIGWVLREYSKTCPEAVAQFVSDHSSELSSLSKREACKYISH
jgi:3-methyladenine DNA glycosylase AlkD